jgi:plasmid stability protein
MQNLKTKTKVTRKQLTVRLPEEVHRALKIRGAEEGRNMGELVERLVRQYLVKEKRT